MTTLQTYGFDHFLGRAVLDLISKKSEIYGLHSFEGGGTQLETDLEELPNLLRNVIRKRERVLISKSPGSLPPRERQTRDVVGLIKAIHNGTTSDDVKKVWEVSRPIDFLVFRPEEMAFLEREYGKMTDLKTFPNPFLYQPD